MLGLGSKKELKQWNILWLKCQQTRHHLEEVLSEALKSSSKESSCRVPKEAGIKINYEPSQSSSHLSSSSDDSIWDFNAKPPHNPPQASLPSGVPSLLLHKHANQNMDVSVQFSASPPQTLAKLFSEPQRTSPNLEDTDSISTSGSASCYSEPIQSPVICHRRHPLKKIMKKTQSFDFTQHESSHSELHRHGYTGVYIKGLEVASNIAAEKKYMQRLNIKSPLISRNRSLSSPSRIHHTEEEDKKRAGRWEMATTQSIILSEEQKKSTGISHMVSEKFEKDIYMQNTGTSLLV